MHKVHICQYLLEKCFKKFYAERELGFFVGCPKEAVVTIFTDAACFNRSIEFDFFSSKALKKLYIYVIMYIRLCLRCGTDMNTLTKAFKTFIRIFTLLLALSLLLVSCEEEKIHFPLEDGDANVTVDKNNKNDKNKGENNNNNNNNSNNNADDAPVSNTGKKRVAITYDDGPHVTRTKLIVDELDKYGFNATFFVIGNRVDGSAYDGSSALKYAASKGNEIAIHAYTHENYYNECSDKTYEKELSLTYDAIKEAVPNANIKLMRPVGGAITQERIESCDYSVVLWNVDSLDWKYKGEGKENVDTIVSNVMSSVKDGSIILMHDIHENTYKATVEILKQLDAQGYEVVTVSELLGNPRPGVRYSRG